LTKSRNTEENRSNTNKRKNSSCSNRRKNRRKKTLPVLTKRRKKRKKKKEKRKKRVHVCDGHNETGKEFEGALVLSNSLGLFFFREFQAAWFCRTAFAVKFEGKT
jgi:hypothetical protein